MAATTLKAIVDVLEAVLAASPFSLKPTKDAFSHDRQPNALLDNSYRIEDGGLVSSRSQTNHAATRIDRLTTFIARKTAFGGRTASETIEDQLVAIERAYKASGLSNGFHVEFVGRKLSQSGDVAIGSIDVTVDYDFSEAVA